MCPRTSTIARVVSVKYLLNAFVEHNVAVELSDPSPDALRDDVDNVSSSSRSSSAESNSILDTASPVSGCCFPQVRLIRCSRCSTPSTPSAMERLSRSFTYNFLSTAEGVTGPVRILMHFDGSSPSNVSLAAGSGSPNPACTLVDVARSTSACDIELSSSALFFRDDGFEGFVGTKNTPPLGIMSSSFSLFLAIQHRSFVKYTSQPESIQGPQRPDWSSHVQHTVDCCDPSYFSVVAHLSSFRAVALLLSAMVSFHSICGSCPLGSF